MRTVDLSSVTRAAGRVSLFGFATLPLLFWLLLWLPARWDLHSVDSDAAVYHRAAQAVRTGGSMYDPLPPPGPHDLGRGSCMVADPACEYTPYYLYPPFLAAMIAAVDVSAVSFRNLVLFINTLSVIAFSFLVPAIAVKPLRWGFALAALMAINVPLLVTIDIGNIEPFVNLLCVAALVVPAGLSAGLLTVGAALKVNPAWAAVVVLIRGGRRARLGGLAAGTFVFAVSIATLGPFGLMRELSTWIEHVAPTLAQGQYAQAGFTIFGYTFEPNFLTGNISPAFAPLFAFPRPAAGETLPVFARLYLGIMQLGVPVIVAYASRKLPWRDQAGLVLCAAMISAPILRMSQLHVLLIVPAILLRHKVATRQRRIAHAAGSERSVLGVDRFHSVEPDLQ